MCGYWFSTTDNISDLAIKNMQLRGPEGTAFLHNSFGYFAHSLLNTIGSAHAQPLKCSNGYLLYNGSTYNSLPDNDAEWLSYQLDDKPETFVEVIKSLQGEYSITYVTDKHIMFCVDQFATRNLYFYYNPVDRIFAISSTVDSILTLYPSATKVEENKIYIIDISIIT